MQLHCENVWMQNEDYWLKTGTKPRTVWNYYITLLQYVTLTVLVFWPVADDWNICITIMVCSITKNLLSQHANTHWSCTCVYPFSLRITRERDESKVNDQWINFQFEKFQHSTKSDVFQEPTKNATKNCGKKTKAIKHIKSTEAVVSDTGEWTGSEFCLLVRLNWNKTIESKWLQNNRRKTFLSSFFWLLPLFYCFHLESYSVVHVRSFS